MPFKRARVLRGMKKVNGPGASSMFQCPLSGQGYCGITFLDDPALATVFQCPLSGQGYCGAYSEVDNLAEVESFNAL